MSKLLTFIIQALQQFLTDSDSSPSQTEFIKNKLEAERLRWLSQGIWRGL